MERVRASFPIRGLLVAFVLAAASVLLPVLPAAAGGVTVVFSAQYGSGTAVAGRPATACPVTVDEGSNGLAVLDAAAAAGCIRSYKVVVYPGLGDFVDCIDRVCTGPGATGPLCSFWAMTENGVLTDYGVDGFHADQGDVLSFTYAPYGTC